MEPRDTLFVRSLATLAVHPHARENGNRIAMDDALQSLDRFYIYCDGYFVLIFVSGSQRPLV